MEFLKLKSLRDGQLKLVNPDSISTITPLGRRNNSTLIMNNGDILEVIESVKEIDMLIISMAETYEIVTFEQS